MDSSKPLNWEYTTLKTFTCELVCAILLFNWIYEYVTELQCIVPFVLDKVIKELNARLAESEAQVASVIQVCCRHWF